MPGLPAQSAAVNLHWPPESDGIQPMPVWPPPTLPDQATPRMRPRSSNVIMVVLTRRRGGGGRPGRRWRPSDDPVPKSSDHVVLRYLTSHPSPPPNPRTPAHVLIPSILMVGYFCVSLMSSTADSPGRSRSASPSTHVCRAV